MAMTQFFVSIKSGDLWSTVERVAGQGALALVFLVATRILCQGDAQEQGDASGQGDAHVINHDGIDHPDCETHNGSELDGTNGNPVLRSGIPAVFTAAQMDSQLATGTLSQDQLGSSARKADQDAILALQGAPLEPSGDDISAAGGGSVGCVPGNSGIQLSTEVPLSTRMYARGAADNDLDQTQAVSLTSWLVQPSESSVINAAIDLDSCLLGSSGPQSSEVDAQVTPYDLSSSGCNSPDVGNPTSNQGAPQERARVRRIGQPQTTANLQDVPLPCRPWVRPKPSWLADSLLIMLPASKVNQMRRTCRTHEETLEWARQQPEIPSHVVKTLERLHQRDQVAARYEQWCRDQRRQARDQNGF